MRTRILLFGADTDALLPEIDNHPQLQVVDEHPKMVVSYGGDGTLLDAELAWPGVPKVPILNSKRGYRCIPHAPAEVLRHLAAGALVSNLYTKIVGVVNQEENGKGTQSLVALNEFNVHMSRINSAVRFKLWLNEDPYDHGVEILGDGFVVCTPFGSTAYFNQITRGRFTRGIGVAFKATNEHTNHIVLAEDVTVRFRITRGPAVLALDSSQEYVKLRQNDELVVRKHEPGAIILTCGSVKRFDEPF